MEAFSAGEARFLRVAGILRGAVFSCREARPLVERRATRVREGSGLAAEEEGGMVGRGRILCRISTEESVRSQLHFSEGWPREL